MQLALAALFVVVVPVQDIVFRGCVVLEEVHSCECFCTLALSQDLLWASLSIPL